MTPEQRLDRLERIARLMVKAGLRARTRMREFDEKFAMLVDYQIANEERFARDEKAFAEYKQLEEQRAARWEKTFADHEKTFADHEKTFAENKKRFAESEKRIAQNEERAAEFTKETKEQTARFVELFNQLTEAQRNTDHKLAELIEIVRSRNGRLSG